MTEIADLARRIDRFAEEREWGQFHSPKNLAMALTVEAAELQEHFQWLTEDESRGLSDEKRAEVATEIADVFIYLVRLSTQLGIDPLEAVERKMTINARNYPVDAARGNAIKYTERER